MNQFPKLTFAVMTPSLFLGAVAAFAIGVFQPFGSGFSLFAFTLATFAFTTASFGFFQMFGKQCSRFSFTPTFLAGFVAASLFLLGRFFLPAFGDGVTFNLLLMFTAAFFGFVSGFTSAFGFGFQFSFGGAFPSGVPERREEVLKM